MQNLSTSEKLRRLARAVLRNRRFNLVNSTHCIAAIGQRFDPETETFTARKVKISLAAKTIFAEKYGITYDDADALYYGEFYGKQVVSDWTSTKQAAQLLEKYAQKYDKVIDFETE